MKISILKCLIFVTIILLSFRANAQNDRIITNANDTIPCKIEESGMFGGYNYDQIKITEKRIKEFYNAYKTLWFRRVFTDHQPKIFMKVIVRGKISIYFNENINGEFWYASKNSDTAVLIHTDRIGFFSGNNKGRKLFADYIKDKKAVYDQYIEIKNPDVEDMQQLARLYNVGEHLK